MHIFFAYTTKTFAFKSVVFQRRWGTELFFHAKVCISVVSRLFKETCPVKWKPSGLQFINEHCQYKIKIKKSEYSTTAKKLQIFVFLSAAEITCGESVSQIHAPVFTTFKTQGGTGEQLSKSSSSRHCLHLILTLCPVVGSDSLPPSPLVFTWLQHQLFGFLLCVMSQFPVWPILGIYLSPGCPPASVDCCNEWLWYLPYFIPTTFGSLKYGIFTHFPTLWWMPGSVELPPFPHKIWNY